MVNTSDRNDFIRENIRYDKETGDLFWAKQIKGPGRPRDLSKPLGRKQEVKGRLRCGSPKQRVVVSVLYKNILAHRLAWFLWWGEWPPKALDHIDGNPLNNRIDNLRLASNQQNSFNSCAPSGERKSKWGYKGVVSYTTKGRGQEFYAQLRKDGQAYYSSRLSTPEEAAQAYDTLAIKHFGEHAYLNFP